MNNRRAPRSLPESKKGKSSANPDKPVLGSRQAQREVINQKRNESIRKATATSVNTSGGSNISKGMNVHYTKNNATVTVKVIDVKFDDRLEPYYLIKMPDGREIQ